MINHNDRIDRAEMLAADYDAKQRLDAAFNTPSSALREISELKARIAELEAALKAVIGMLDDPTGDEHVRDMRGATIIARAVLKGGTR